MTMQSKFASTCKACGAMIAVGETIDWTKGVGARHATPAQCAAAKALAAQSEKRSFHREFVV